MSEVQAVEVASAIHDVRHPPALSLDHVDNDTTSSPVKPTLAAAQLLLTASLGIFARHPLSQPFGHPLHEHVLPS